MPIGLEHLPLFSTGERRWGADVPALLAAHWSVLHVAEQDTCRSDSTLPRSPTFAGNVCTHCGKRQHRIDLDRTKFVARAFVKRNALPKHVSAPRFV